MKTTLKKTLSIILAILMVMTSVPLALAADGHTHALSADGENIEFTEFTADITGISTEANYYLTQDIELTKVLNINVEGTVNLCLNGHSITTTAKTSNNTVIMLTSGTLNLCDCQGSGCITTASEDFSNQGIFGVNASEINMYSGEIKGFTFRGLTAPTVNMYGGKITGCDRGVSTVKRFNMYGGEISGCKSALSLESDTNEFTMHGGKIINNEVTNSAYAPVNIEKGVFTMNGGEVNGNQTSGYSAVYVHAEGSFIMNGGKISDNVGDGVYNCGNTIINAGEISGNTNAGVCFENASTLTLKGGKITNNGSGIKAFYYVTAYLAGDGVQVTGNKDEDVSYRVGFEVSEQLTPEKTQIGISGYSSGVVFARPDGTNITTLEGMEACFYGTDDVFQVVECEGGELYLTLSNPYIYENENGDYVVETPFDEGVTFAWYENGRFLEGETSAVLSKDKIKPGNKYACSVSVDGVIEAELEKECPSRITHQPTAGEPYVELNDDTDASYQWYIVEEKTTEITDENASVISNDFGESFYDKETGWTGVQYIEDFIGREFFTVDLKAGETLTVEASGDFTDYIGLIDVASDIWVDVAVEPGITSYELTVEADGNYRLYTFANSENVTVKVYKTAVEKTAIGGETSAKLKNPEFGKKYVCEVIYADGKNEKTDIFEYTYAITHQPTEEEPYVELNDDTAASYQWYTVEGEGYEVTNENAFGDWPIIGYPMGSTVYKDGKWIADGSMGTQYYFMVELEAGDTINFEFASEVEQIIFAINGNADEGIAVGGTECSVTVEESGTYWLITPPVDYVCADVGNIAYNAIEGETAAVLNPTALGRYACEVTFADGTTEMSDTFEVTKLHDCDFSGEWKYDAEKHWKECAVDGCSKISEEAGHTYTDGKCACGYVCSHEKYTDGVCDKCDYECAHEWGEGVLTRPTFETDGYYTYTCTLCGHSYTEPTNKADDTALKDASMKVTEYIDNDTLTQEAIDKIDKSYRDIVRDNGNIFDEFGFVRGDLVEEDQPAINAITEELQKIIDEAEEKIASGEYVKINGLEEIVKINDKLNEELTEKYGEEALTEITDKIGDKYDEKFDELYEKAEALTGSVAENKEALEEIESEMEAIFAEIEKCLAGVHNGFVYEVTEEAKCGVNAIESATCTLCGETDEREVEGSALEHSFTKYEETEAPKCGVAGKEVAYCDNGCQTTDEREIPALEHSFLDYVSNGDATCEADGTKTAECANGCGATDTVADEGSQLDHVDEDGDKICDDCQAEIVDVCPDCGRPAHEDSGISRYICILIMLIRLVISFFKAI